MSAVANRRDSVVAQSSVLSTQSFLFTHPASRFTLFSRTSAFRGNVVGKVIIQDLPPIFLFDFES